MAVPPPATLPGCVSVSRCFPSVRESRGVGRSGGEGEGPHAGAFAGPGASTDARVCTLPAELVRAHPDPRCLCARLRPLGEFHTPGPQPGLPGPPPSPDSRAVRGTLDDVELSDPTRRPRLDSSLMNKAPLRSMTGFGESEVALPSARLRVEVRTVNHRFLNLQLRVPPGFERHEVALERKVREFFTRGHVKVSVAWELGSTGEGSELLAVNLVKARGYVEALKAIQVELGIGGSIDIGTLARFRDLFLSPERDALPEVPEEVLLGVTGEAAAAALRMREEEGFRMAADLVGRIQAMEREVGAIERRAPDRLIAERDRLREALRELLDGAISVDEERLAREIAHLAERWDIHEEVVRFRSHLAMFHDTLASGDAAGVGKRLGFIAQELLREANTMGSKANDAEIAARVITLKEEIERLREQLENIE
ncbi:MAG: YicC family protein [Gemmatimonadetes bacterium]|nr:YicC family protein [Gemmatimonadota bacterium]